MTNLLLFTAGYICAVFHIVLLDNDACDDAGRWILPFQVRMLTWMGIGFSIYYLLFRS